MTYAQESGENVMLKSVFQHGNIEKYQIMPVRNVNASGLADGVYLVTIQTLQDQGVPKLINCILIKDVNGYKEASYALGLLDCDGHPNIKRPEDKIDITPLSTGDLLKNVSKGFYEIIVPANEIPGYEHPIKCFIFTHPQGSLNVFIGYGGMSCEFGERTGKVNPRSYPEGAPQ